MIEYQLIRSKRRTLSICVDQEGALVVRAPMRMPKREIEAFLKQKQRWIEEKQKAAREREGFVIEENGTMPWLGGTLALRRAEGSAPFEKDGILFVPPEGEWYAWVREWRLHKAQEIKYSLK